MVVEKKRLLYRLKFYGFGFALGCIIVWATLIKDRDRPSWLPEGRVLEFIEAHDIKINDKLKCQLDCYNIPINFMDKTFWEQAEVDFKQSATKRKPCPEYKITSNGIIVYIEVCEQEETATLRGVDTLSGKDNLCACK